MRPSCMLGVVCVHACVCVCVGVGVGVSVSVGVRVRACADEMLAEHYT